MEFRKFIFKRKVIESDLDNLGHVNNASYLKILEEARWDFLTENGYGLNIVKERKISPIIIKIEIMYKRELTNRENITIESVVTKLIGDHRLVLNQKIFKEDGTLATIADYTMATFDLESRKMVVPTNEFLEATGVIFGKS